MNVLTPWQNFYVIIGSAAGALVGVQFVVIALIADRRQRVDISAINAFGTPTVVHFAGALTLAAIMTAPWPSIVGTATVLGLCGIGGLVYLAVVFRHARRQKEYKPVGEDWWWYLILPGVVYLSIGLAALLLCTATEAALFIIAAAGLCMLLIAVRNAWDTVTHTVSTHPPGDDEKPG